MKAQKETLSTGLRHAIFYPSDGFYKGEWLNGERSGKGKQLQTSGKQYEGDWERNRKHGFGLQSQYIQDEKRFRLTYFGDHVGGKMEVR